MQGFGNGLEDDYKTLLGLLIEVGENLKGHTPEDRRLVDSEPLAGKVVCHACSILFLSRGTRLGDVPEGPIHFVDHASIRVLTRALLESAWAFHHVFVDPETEDEFTFRFCSWKLAGFVQREKFPALTDSAREQLARDKEVVNRDREELESTEAFERLTPRDKKRALNGKLWRPRPLQATAEAFLGKKFGAATYAWLSSYQHGDALSAIQIRAADTYERQRQAAEIPLWLVAISLSQMIKAYVRLWPQLGAVTNRDPNTEDLVETYARFPEFDPDID